MAARLAEGDPAPDFTLQDQDGRPVSLSDFRGRRVVLYFYPKDNTPGCTLQARELRDNHEAILEAGAVVLGVSPDSAASHCKFREKYALPFPLLVDDEHTVAQAYGVWKQKNMFGVKFWGNERSTFVIGPDGDVERAMLRVRPIGHVSRVLDAIEP